jgi:hypothetical protein
MDLIPATRGSRPALRVLLACGRVDGGALFELVGVDTRMALRGRYKPVCAVAVI